MEFVWRSRRTWRAGEWADVIVEAERDSQSQQLLENFQMSLIFSQAGLRDIRPPGVLQSFVNHGVVLHKVFVVGEKHFTVDRPSLKNFSTGPHGECTLCPTITYHHSD
ncbi:inositol-tetrakisphosphate 1-kinase [Silurus meridionalis]|nr:inositol-tetrakisphosphate 1-kinase [Silurus meridionalis]